MAFLSRLFGKRDPLPTPFLDRLGESGELVAAHRYEDALAALDDLERNPPPWSALDLLKLRSLILGRVGTCLFQTLRPEEALPKFEEAIALCIETGDKAGVRVHLGNRIETLRWLDRHREAVPVALELADRWDEEGDERQAARWRSRSRVMARGEPLLRATMLMDDQFFELDELPALTGKAVVVLERNRLPLWRAKVLTDEGERHGEAVEYDQALASYAAAMKADPTEPHPHYETAFTHMLQGRYAEAIQSYETTERLAPGWFQVRWGLWLARQLHAGRFHPTVPHALSQLEHAPPEEGAELGRLLTQTFPDLSSAWAHLVDHLRALGQEEEALAAVRSGLARAEEPDSRSRLLVALSARDPLRHAADLEEAIRIDGNLVAGALARVLLNQAAAVN